MAKKSIYIAILVGAVLVGWLLKMGQQPVAPKSESLMPIVMEQNNQESQVTIGSKIFRVEIAKTPEQKARGLSGRDSLDQDAGMLFIFDQAGIYPFWMKDMRFPIDIIWIANNRIVDMSHNVPAPKSANEPPAVVAPKVPVDKVLEINAGLSEKYGFQVGDVVQLFQ